MKRSYWTLLGLMLFGIGALSFILALVGIKLTMLKFLVSLGTGPSVIIRIVMMMAGMIIMYLSKMDLSEE